jgi:hypothetical protein
VPTMGSWFGSAPARVRLIRLTVAAVPGGTGVPTTRRLSVALERPS